MKNLKHLMSLAFEEQTNATTQREDEVVMYCEVKDETGLAHAKSKESHEQWEIKTDAGRVRIRKTVKEGLVPSFDLTFKTKSETSGIKGNIEKTFSIDSEMFESFKAIASQGMIKDRYLFEVQSVQVKTSEGVKDIVVSGMHYEVDMFIKPGAFSEQEGRYQAWCKIDLEVNPLLDEINKNHPEIGDFALNIKVRGLPINFGDIILSTDEDVVTKDRISKLYEQYFLTKK